MSRDEETQELQIEYLEIDDVNANLLCIYLGDSRGSLHMTNIIL